MDFSRLLCLSVSDRLIESGEWDPVACTMGDSCIISKAAVQEWVETKLRGE